MERQVVSSARHHCTFEGCGKSFIRKEHLTRHALSHTEAPSYICNVCNRAFTRNDVLQKHIKGHAAKHDTVEGNKRACQPCHRAKTRCAGGLPCQSCLKRRINCTFDIHQNSSISPQESSTNRWQEQPTNAYDYNFGTTSGMRSHGSTSSVESSQYRYGSVGSIHAESPVPRSGRVNSIIQTSTHMAGGTETHTLTVNKAMEFDSQIHSQAVSRAMQSQIVNTANACPPISFQASYFVVDPNWHIGAPSMPPPSIPPPPGPPPQNSGYMNRVHANPIEGQVEACELYFEKFHLRWPIIHLSSYDEKESPSHLNYSIIMIGNHLKGSDVSRVRSIEIHNRLMDTLFPKLAWRPASDENPAAWSIFQSCLLNIIFAFYTGESTLISRAIMLLNTLVNVLREIGLFRPETAMPKFRSNVFRPWAMVLIEQRKRLVISLFKIDAYIAFFCSQSPLLRPEEMHFPLPATYTFWNSRTLEYFEAFLSREPPGRFDTSIFDLMRSPFNGTPGTGSASMNGARFDSLTMFPEDIQIGLCSLQSSIWESFEKARDGTVDAATLQTIRALLVQQLDYWKSKLDGFQLYDDQEPYTPLSSLSPTAVRSSFPSTSNRNMGAGVSTAYYHGLESYALPSWQSIVFSRPRSLIFDTTMLYDLLSIHIYTDIRNLCRLSNYQNQDTIELRHRRLSATTWASSQSAIKALAHAGKILELCRTDGRGFAGAAAEPITNMALYVGALIVWAWNAFSGTVCDGSCQSGQGPPSGIYMDGLPLCGCTTKEANSRFRSYISGGDNGWAGHLAKFQGR